MTLIDHKKARFDYEIMDKYEAGIELLGFEVKSLMSKRGSLEGAFVIARGGEAFLMGASIPPYQAKNTPAGYDPYRTRRLLLKKSEINSLAGKESANGLTIVPLSMYNKGTKIKIEIAVARHKKKHDKRELIKKRETDREMRRELKVR
jgi:SsrA-binding protein